MVIDLAGPERDDAHAAARRRDRRRRHPLVGTTYGFVMWIDVRAASMASGNRTIELPRLQRLDHARRQPASVSARPYSGGKPSEPV